MVGTVKTKLELQDMIPALDVEIQIAVEYGEKLDHKLITFNPYSLEYTVTIRDSKSGGLIKSRYLDPQEAVNQYNKYEI